MANELSDEDKKDLRELVEEMASVCRAIEEILNQADANGSIEPFHVRDGLSL